MGSLLNSAILPIIFIVALVVLTIRDMVKKSAKQDKPPTPKA